MRMKKYARGPVTSSHSGGEFSFSHQGLRFAGCSKRVPIAPTAGQEEQSRSLKEELVLITTRRAGSPTVRVCVCVCACLGYLLAS